jgi:ADP-ribose pyrophosphatase YjhB (NUDIX family)
MDLHEALTIIASNVSDPTLGLPDEVFYFISRNTPLVNVDLLVRDEKKRVLLAWRKDAFSGTGWHVPGGIVRLKERLIERVEKVSLFELGARVDYDPVPMAVNELINHQRSVRSHFISFLFNCWLPSSFTPLNKNRGIDDPGYLAWHESCPENMISAHEIYRDTIKKSR